MKERKRLPRNDTAARDTQETITVKSQTAISQKPTQSKKEEKRGIKELDFEKKTRTRKKKRDVNEQIGGNPDKKGRKTKLESHRAALGSSVQSEGLDLRGAPGRGKDLGPTHA